MSANQLVTGPALVYIQTAASTDWFFLGTYERSPIIELIRPYEPSMNALGGVTLPFDKFFQGQEAMIGGVINRPDYSVMALMRNAPWYGGVLSTTLGANNYFDLGAGAMKNGASFGLVMRFLYYGAPDADPGLPPGYWFFNCTVDKDSQSEMVTVPMAFDEVFHASRIYVPFSTSSPYAPSGGMVTYTTILPNNLPAPS